MSGDALERVVQLVTSGQLFQRGYGGSTFVAVCGEVVISGPNGAGVVHPSYCLECVGARFGRVRWACPPRGEGGVAQ
jgi:hypothetical protein